MMSLMRTCLLSILLLCTPALAIQDPVRTSGGLLSGAPGEDPSVRVYKGIPYAQPPIGDLRWKAPQEAAHWQGVRPATEFSKECYQAPYPRNSIYFSEPQPMSEDCLYLNVWTAAKSVSERRPVMVWIHGGALTRGSGSLPVYDGEHLARKGAVVVTINYRLGVFGFLAHPELTAESAHRASGNYAFLDQIAALAWVKQNIAAFGGDPARVTIFGESAGSWSVNYLMATPLAKGLFHRAIGESGGAFGPMQTLAQAEQIGSKFGPSLAALRSMSAENLLKAAGSTSFPPNVDGWMLPTDVYTIFEKGQQNDVPLIVGSNADEGKSLAPWPANGTAAAFTNQMKARFGADAGELLKLYPAGSDEQARESHYASFRDFSFGWQMRTWARLQTKTGKSKASLYYFSRVPPSPLSARLGAYHAAEIQYVFGNLKPNRPWEDADRSLSEEMGTYWVNFAKTGDPNAKGLPEWAAYQTKTDTALELGDRVQEVRGLHQAALDFFDRYFAGQRMRSR